MSVSIGVDVSKDHLDWAAGSEGKIQRVPNSARGIGRLVAALGKLSVAQVVVESTGGYERGLLDALERHEIPTALVNPWRVRRFGEGLGVFAATAADLPAWSDASNAAAEAVAATTDADDLVAGHKLGADVAKELVKKS